MNDKDITEALNSIEPSDEALSRILSNVLEANEQKVPEVKGETSKSSSPASPFVTSHPVSQPVKKRFIGKTALPLAASFIILLGVGMFALTQQNIFEGDFAPSKDNKVTTSDTNDSTEHEKPETNSSGTSENTYDQSESFTGDPNSFEYLSEEGSDASPAKQSQAQYYPLIESPSLGRLYIIDNGESTRSIADAKLVGDKIEDAVAKNTLDSEETDCTIFKYSSDDIVYYAVQYKGDDTYYRATSFSR